MTGLTYVTCPSSVTFRPLARWTSTVTRVFSDVNRIVQASIDRTLYGHRIELHEPEDGIAGLDPLSFFPIDADDPSRKRSIDLQSSEGLFDAVEFCRPNVFIELRQTHVHYSLIDLKAASFVVELKSLDFQMGIGRVYLAEVGLLRFL